ncbi:MAG: zinc ABC transporter substrate-binding protein [Zoogloeaceae bacterium]|nr:zinc ABC transporter substrate-binding protein [Zoogloeaceae bacterium]
MRRFVQCVLAVLALLMGATAQGRPLQVVTTLAQIAEPLALIAGPGAVVSSLMGPGVDPHLYRLTRSDVAKLAQADLIVANGLHLEVQLEEMLATLASRKPVVAIGDFIDPALIRHPAGELPDPHVWMDPTLWRAALQGAVAALEKADPAGGPGYRARAATYFTRLGELSTRVGEVMGSVPQASRVLVTAHDAFGYFGRAYGLEVMAIQGISTESEAGLRRIEELVETLVQRRIRAVFVESSVSPRSVRALIDGARARGHEVVVGGELYSDAMGAPGSYTGTYLGMIDHNASTIAKSLGGRVPAGGLAGRLTNLP